MTNDLEVEREFEVNSQPSSSSSNSLHILQLINTCIPLLNHEQNIQEIEENITKLPLNEIIIRDSAVNEFIQALENFQNRSDIQINAKLRRRAKRLIESLMKLQSNEVQSATTEANINEENIVVTIVAKVPLSKTLELLKSVHSFHEMEYALNSMELPDFQTINKDQSEGQKTLKILSDIQSLLEKYLASDNGTLTNRKLRHRIKKIVYILSGGGVNLKRTAAYAIEDQPVKQKPVSEKKAVIQRPVITLSHPLLTSFQNLKTAEELNDILVGVPSRCDELLIYLDSRLEVAQALFDTLSSKVEFASGETASKSSKILLTAKIRRKVSRFAEALKEIITPNLQNSTPSDEDCTEIKIEVTASKKRKELGSKSEDTFPSVQSVDDSTKEVRSNSNTSTESSKLTTYEDFIHSLREANSDTIIQLLQPFCADWRKILGLGCCKTRRSLKRALEALLSSENLQSHKSLIEQSLSTLETITMAAVQAHLESTHNSTSQAEHQTDAPKKKKQKLVETEEEAESHQGVTNNVSSHKHILFIGQLSYDTTSDDLLNYLKATGVEGDISVRILTDKETGKSRGAAFIDFFGGKRSLKRIMDLHHTMLKGRRINVEHTSKHHAQNIEENEQHALDTKHQRMQQKILDSEKIDNLLREYSHLNLGTKGGMIPDDHLMNRLYAMTVNEVKEVLEEYSQIQSTKNPNSSNGNLHLLRKLITKRDGGGSAVDQTRESSGIARGREEDHYVGENKKQRTDGFGKFRATDDKKDELSSASSVRVGSGGRGIVQGRGQSSEVFKVFQGRGRGR